MRSTLPRLSRFIGAWLTVMLIIGGWNCFRTSISSADTNGNDKPILHKLRAAERSGHFIMYRDGNGVSCRNATPEERRMLNEPKANVALHPITPPRAQDA